MFRKFQRGAVLAALALPFHLPAQDSHVAQDEYDADPLLVTATKTVQHQSQALSSSIIIDRREIDRLQPASVEELLRGRAGIATANNGGIGKTTSFFLRGTNSDQTLFLVDGVRMASATTGRASIQDIPVEQIERIEIVKGPRSSLYGADAVGGVIQIFTRDGRGAHGLQPSFSVSGGSNAFHRVTGGLAGGNDDGWFSLNLSRTKTRGFDGCGGSLNERFQCSTQNDLDRDGYENLSVNLRGGYALSEWAELDFTFFQALSESEFDPGASFFDQKQQIINANLLLKPADFWDVTLRVGRNKDEQDVFDENEDFDGAFNTDRYTLGLQNDFRLNRRNVITVGLDYYEDSVNTTNPPPLDSKSRDNVAGFAQYQGRFGPHSLQASIRHDENEDFGGEQTGDVAYGFDVTDNITLRGSYGTAFKAPSFNSLFFPDFGNPDLAAETSETFELGVDARYRSFSWSISAYQTDIDDLIINAADPSALFGISPQNIGKSRIRGLELSGRLNWGDWLISTQVDFMEPEIRSGDNAGNVLPRRHEQSFRIDLDRSLGDKLSLGGSFLAVGRRYDNESNDDRLAGYGLVDLRARYQLSTAWQLQGKISNLLDKDYETARNFAQPDREFLVTLRYQPQY